MSQRLAEVVLLSTILVAASACSSSPAQSAATVTATIRATATTEAAVVETGATYPPATPQPTALPTATEVVGCVHAAEVVADVTISAGSIVAPGSGLVKTWRVRNSGSCPWQSGTRLNYVGGIRMNGPAVTAVSAIANGSETEISINVIAPDIPDTYESRWQLHTPEGEPFGPVLMIRIEVKHFPTPLTPPPPTATATPAARPSETPTNAPAVLFFSADVEYANPGDMIHLSWETVNATEVTMYRLMPSGQLGMPYWEVASSGVLSYTVAQTERNAVRFVLFAGDSSAMAQATVAVLLYCPDEWFFEPAPEECPSGPSLVSAAAEQQFQHGHMVWLREQGLVYALFDNGNSPKWKIFEDKWREGEIEYDPNIVPPAGYVQPLRGFGLVWREEPGVRDRLGWGLSAEVAFVSEYQTTSRFKYNEYYLRAQDGRIWRLEPEGSAWTKLSP